MNRRGKLDKLQDKTNKFIVAKLAGGFPAAFPAISRPLC